MYIPRCTATLEFIIKYRMCVLYETNNEQRNSRLNEEYRSSDERTNKTSMDFNFTIFVELHLLRMMVKIIESGAHNAVPIMKGIN